MFPFRLGCRANLVGTKCRVIRWFCGLASSPFRSHPYNCSGYPGGDVTGRVDFPTCWDGNGISRDDMAYASSFPDGACPSDWLEEIGAYAEREGLPLHVHADEQPREIEECLAEHGVRPIELLARCGCLGERTTIIHATHADASELELLAAHRSTVCVCPTTEADLGDGFAPAGEWLARGIAIAIGSDSNVRIDPLEELRELEGIARRESLQRGVFSPDALLQIGTVAGARSLALPEWEEIEIDLEHRSLAGVAAEHVCAALVAGCGADVVLAR